MTRSLLLVLVVCLACYTHAQLPGGSLPGGPGTPTGNSTSGPIPGGSGGIGGLMQMGPHAPNAIHHVGIAYNLLKGNPDGEYWSTGGEDPGVSLTRKIFTISPGDNPPEAIIEHHDGCQYSHGFSLFYNTKSYQDKLYTNVQTSGTADAALKPYGFTLSSAYQAVAQQTSRHHYVFQDATTYCKIGHVRYSMNLASSDHYPVNREFALDVCHLPTAYSQAEYMKFIEDWGTHIMTEVVIGKLTTNRYLGNLRDLFNFVMFNVTEEISLGGPVNGYSESYVIDTDSFKYRHEYKYIVGVFEDMLTVGDMYYNDVIGKTLQTIDMALDAKYWHWMQYYVAQNICSSDASSHLSAWQANIVQALKAYPTYKKANLPAVEPLAMPVTWPLGSYTLLKPTSGCPSGFSEGSVVFTEQRHSGGPPTGLNLAGQITSTHIELNFCTKEDPSPTKFDIYWPRGDYCFHKKDNCPNGFMEGYLRFGLQSALNSSGVLPYVGTPYTYSLHAYFCCRSDGVYSKPMFLPSKIPFYLYRGTHGCQAVSGMRVQEQMLSFYDSINASGYVPYMDTSTGADGATKYTLHLCYYTTLT